MQGFTAIFRLAAVKINGYNSTCFSEISISIRGASKPRFYADMSAAGFVLLNHKATAFLNRKALPATHISRLKIFDLCH